MQFFSLRHYGNIKYILIEWNKSHTWRVVRLLYIMYSICFTITGFEYSNNSTHRQVIIKPKTVHNLLSARLYNWNWSPFTRELRLSEGDQTKLNIDIDALPFLIRLPRYVVTQIWWDLPINQIWLKYFNRTRLSLPAQPRGERSRDLLTTYWIVSRLTWRWHGLCSSVYV